MESGYRLEWSVDGDVWPSTNYQDIAVASYPSGGVVEMNQTLDANPDYLYRVRAFDATTFSDASEIVSAHTPRDDSVMVEAVAGSSGITLRWLSRPGTFDHIIYRKPRGDNEWRDVFLLGPPGPDPQTYTDQSALPGSEYEYAVGRHVDNGLEGGAYEFGYIYAGNAAPLVEDRGRVLLVVDQTIASDLDAELSLLKRDLTGDGWNVQRADVPRVDIPRTNNNPDFTAYKQAINYTKTVIKNVYLQAPATLKAILLIGHVPVPYSGYAARDGHTPGTPFDHRGAWPADSYYGEMNGEWTDEGSSPLGPEIINADFPENSNRVGDGKFDHDVLPSAVEVPVGRVDFADMPIFLANQSSSEIDLLKRYLAKNRGFRHGSLTVQTRALVDDHWNEHYAQNAWRNFAPLIGRAQTLPRNWSTTLQAESYLWAYGTGAGSLDTVHGVADLNDYAGAAQVKRGIFNMIFGSYVGDWDKTNNFARAVLGSESHALTYAWVGNTHWFLHPMGLGEPIAGSLLSTINTTPGDQPYASPGTRQHEVQISLLGDPTLRMHIVKPPKNVRAQTLPDAAGRWITWTHSDDATSEGFLGYHVYRATSPDGPFVRVTQDYITGTAYTDAFIDIGQHTYMVRAIKKETTPSGTYINASTGVFVQTTGANALARQFIYQTDQGITVQFDRNVSSALSGADLTLTRVGDDEFSATVTLVSYNPNTNTATFGFSGSFGSILPDGNYRATIIADDVTLNDEPMTEDMVLDFFVLGGDANGDRTVNMSDYNIMAANFGQTGKTFAEGNFDYDPAGTVNTADHNVLAGNFGAVLNPPPSGPGQVTVSVVSSNQVELTWIDDVEGETGWRVQRSTDGAVFDWYDNIEGDENSYTATNLQDGKKYWFRVRAYSDPIENPGGPETAYTPKKSGITLLPPPTNLSVQLSGGTTANLTWLHASQNATTAVVQRSTDGFNWTSIEQLAAETAYQSSGLSSGMRYYFRVLLKNDLIESAPSYVEYVDVL